MVKEPPRAELANAVLHSSQQVTGTSVAISHPSQCIVPPYGRVPRQRDRSPVAIGPIPRLVLRSHVNQQQEHPSRCEKSCRKSKWRFAFPCRAYRERVKPGCQQAWISGCFHGPYPETLAVVHQNPAQESAIVRCSESSNHGGNPRIRLHTQ